MSARTEIRDGVLARLQAVAVPGGALDGYTVQSSRVDPVDDADPNQPPPRVVLVYADTADGETLTTGAYGAAFCSRDTVTVQVDVLTAAGTGMELEAAMDAAEAGVLDTLLSDQTWLDSLATHPSVRVQTTTFRDRMQRLGGMVSVTLDCVAPTREVL